MYREHGARLWRAVLLASGSREVADDAVAEAFAQALRRGRCAARPRRLGVASGVPSRGGRAEGARASGRVQGRAGGRDARSVHRPVARARPAPAETAGFHRRWPTTRGGRTARSPRRSIRPSQRSACTSIGRGSASEICWRTRMPELRERFAMADEIEPRISGARRAGAPRHRRPQLAPSRGHRLARKRLTAGDRGLRRLRGCIGVRLEPVAPNVVPRPPPPGVDPPVDLASVLPDGWSELPAPPEVRISILLRLDRLRAARSGAVW